MILITGINGFVGKHLTRELSSRGVDIVGLGHIEDRADDEIAPLLKSYFQCDITKPKEVEKLPLADVTAVINLAGLANNAASFKNPDLYMDVNVKVLSVLGAALLKENPVARMVAISTGALYRSAQSMPLTEESEVISEGSPYSLSKLAMERAAAELRMKGQDCVAVRPFNHIGPGQLPGFLVPDLFAKIREAQKSGAAVSVGNLKTIRDYTDVRDVVRAYADLALAKSLPNTLYNVCSGAGHTGEEIMTTICGALEIDQTTLDIRIDESLIRPSDPEKIIGSHNRLTADTSWKPQIKLSQTIRDIANQ